MSDHASLHTCPRHRVSFLSAPRRREAVRPKGQKRLSVNGSSPPRPLRTPEDLEGSDLDSHAKCGCAFSDSEAPPPLWNPGRSWAERRRDPRVNGADIYVARVTKSGLGNAKPCWRCLEWCRWAGVKRVFHWNAGEQRFEMVKVNGTDRENYETRADTRLFAGLTLE
ncbi:hypothetical protein PHLGIDRAFT_442456 [Phlebiopsis gigantea 11061_1 CR5-6]|uniref:CMP/dCMP-type deaminase domain-containing protein n=1 Tax=Phlebiopsis gigantea (strain 11061_1 CR5-6) TaxID=745531 RepID=A0A0C3S7N4_PHLG1|nr:hypothetical protein PHLGIDRAFT_442456 [Phlebiopsis gigantea 11061_1 CR5-6]